MKVLGAIQEGVFVCLFRWSWNTRGEILPVVVLQQGEEEVSSYRSVAVSRNLSLGSCDALRE